MFSSRLNYIKHYGIIRPTTNGYVFKAYPDKDCPILEIKDRSKWNLIDTVYNIIQSFK